ncbi:MAG: phage portal protein, partial [Lachnospiraceae bacterium]|nr:phage portal protein [Lachnospiraceae bacterium]
KNLATYGSVKVRYDGETKGGVESLEVTVNADNYKAIVELFKKALIENGMGFDAKDDRLSGNPNQMNIQSMYSDIDLDANDMETEFQATFEKIFWFVNAHLANIGKGSFEAEDVNIIFNRDMMMNEGDIIDNIQKSVGILSKQTLVAQHPWTDDVEAELQKIEEEEQAEQEKMMQYDPYQQSSRPGQDGGMNGGEE